MPFRNPVVASFGVILYEMANGWALPLQGTVPLLTDMRGYG